MFSVSLAKTIINCKSSHMTPWHKIRHNRDYCLINICFSYRGSNDFIQKNRKIMILTWIEWRGDFWDFLLIEKHGVGVVYMDVLKVQLAACKVGIYFQMTNQLSTQSSITKKTNITSVAQGLQHLLPGS